MTPISGIDGHDYKPHGYKHKKTHHSKIHDLHKKTHSLYGVEFPGLLTEKGYYLYYSEKL